MYFILLVFLTVITTKAVAGAPVVTMHDCRFARNGIFLNQSYVVKPLEGYSTTSYSDALAGGGTVFAQVTAGPYMIPDKPVLRLTIHNIDGPNGQTVKDQTFDSSIQLAEIRAEKSGNVYAIECTKMSFQPCADLTSAHKVKTMTGQTCTLDQDSGRFLSIGVVPETTGAAVGFTYRYQPGSDIETYTISSMEPNQGNTLYLEIRDAINTGGVNGYFDFGAATAQVAVSIRGSQHQITCKKTLFCAMPN